MSLLAALRYRLKSLLRPAEHARELEEEIRFHLSLDAMGDHDAAHRFGNVTYYREETRAMSGIDAFNAAQQDLRFALRTLRRSPGFAAVAVLTIALGIGATTAIFSVVDAVILRPLPYADADRIVMVWLDNRRLGNHEDFHSVPNLTDIRAQSKSLAYLAPYRESALNLTGAGEPQRIVGGFLPPAAFTVLGVQPLIGRAFTADNEIAGNDNFVLLSYGLWQSAFGGSRDVVGKPLEVNGRKATVVGVMPRAFAFPSERSQLWVPLVIPEPLKTQRGSFAYPAMGRLAPGVSLAAARAELNGIGKRLEQAYPTNAGYGITVTPLPEQMVGPTLRTTLWIMLGAVLAVLLIACANVANLLLSRAAVREREVSVRVALGASNSRLVRQFLTESLLLSCIGGAVGLGVGVLGLRAFRVLAPADLPRASDIGLNATVLLVSFAATILTGLLFGIVPAIQSSRSQINETLREGGRGGTAGRGGQRLRRTIVEAQLAIVVVLLTGAGLLTRTFIALQSVSLGFESHGVATMSLQLPASKYQQPTQADLFLSTLLERIREMPGVKGAGTVTAMMLSKTPASGDITAEGRDNGKTDDEVTFDVASPGFFDAIGARIVAGRNFASADRGDGAPVAIINEHMAKHYWPTANAVGKRFHGGSAGVDTTRVPWRTVVGVVADMRRTGVDMPVRDETFSPYAQNIGRGAMIVAKTTSDPAVLLTRMRDAVRALDASQPVANLRTMDDVLSRLMAQRRFSMTLVAAFACLAFALAIVGAYGVTSYLVSQRTKEIGVRLALGAEPTAIARFVVLDGLRVALVGVASGVVVALPAARFAASMVYGISPRDPLTIGGVAAVMLAVAALANYVPARRAARVDPLAALRQD